MSAKQLIFYTNALISILLMMREVSNGVIRISLFNGQLKIPLSPKKMNSCHFSPIFLRNNYQNRDDEHENFSDRC